MLPLISWQLIPPDRRPPIADWLTKLGYDDDDTTANNQQAPRIPPGMDDGVPW
jgi:hypothetical protein